MSGFWVQGHLRLFQAAFVPTLVLWWCVIEPRGLCGAICREELTGSGVKFCSCSQFPSQSDSALVSLNASDFQVRFPLLEGRQPRECLKTALPHHDATNPAEMTFLCERLHRPFCISILVLVRMTSSDANTTKTQLLLELLRCSDEYPRTVFFHFLKTQLPLTSNGRKFYRLPACPT